MNKFVFVIFACFFATACDPSATPESMPGTGASVAVEATGVSAELVAVPAVSTPTAGSASTESVADGTGTGDESMPVSVTTTAPVVATEGDAQ